MCQWDNKQEYLSYSGDNDYFSVMIIVCWTQIQKDISAADRESYPGLAMACYLLKSGADSLIRNQQNENSLDLVTEPHIRDILKKYTRGIASRSDINYMSLQFCL